MGSMDREKARIVLDVTAGGAAPITFVEGTPQPPFSVGRAAGFRIDGPGVLDVHAYLVFDGVRVFACSAAPANPLLVEGRPVSGQWLELRPPCRLRFGAVEGALLAAPPTGRGSLRPPTAMPPNASMPPPNAPKPVTSASLSPSRAPSGAVAAVMVPAPAPSGSLPPAAARASREPRPAPIPPSGDSEMTRLGFDPNELASLEAMSPGVMAGPRPAAGVPAAAPSPTTASGSPPAAGSAKALPESPKTGRAPVRKDSSAQKRMIAVGVLGLSLLVAIVVVVKKRSPPPPAPPATPTASPALEWSAATAPSRGVIVYPAPRVEADAQATKGDGGPSTSLDRVAVDALYRGDLDAAAKAYEALAAQHPENPAYARAARTLRR